jgi:HAD superfamily hydrolase (TIGR01509 family)
MRLIAGLERFLNEARQLGVPMALATSAGRENIEFVMGGLGIGSFFSAIVAADDVQRGKPHPDLFLAAAQRLAVPPGDCLVFEDSLADIEAARRAEMRTVAITTAHAASELSYPSVVRIIQDYTSLELASLREWAA